MIAWLIPMSVQFAGCRSALSVPWSAFIHRVTLLSVIITIARSDAAVGRESEERTGFEVTVNGVQN